MTYSIDSTFVIAFGSCNHEDDPQTIWQPILENEPDLWIWLGDNIYGDTNDMEVLNSKYELQKSHPEYQKLKLNVPIIGTWDDHDYGRNNAGKHYSQKEKSMQLALDFLDEPENSSRREQQGIYASYDYGNAQTRIKVILLDARYNRDSLISKNDRYIPNENGDILGEEQWKWLESELNKSEADVNIIASGIQIIPDQHPYEKWSNFPKSRQRLYSLIASSGVKDVFFLSGDRHIGEISRKDVAGVDNPIYEVTSSGMTHSAVNNTTEKNPYRLGPLVNNKNFGIMKIGLTQNDPTVKIFIKGIENQIYASDVVK
tara:strand:- start:1258 stop:2202 length:945 start_codon:yes stop_codon:yes gene_type:complete